MARRWPWMTAAAVFALDRASKHLIETRVAEWEAIAVVDGFFRIVHTRNTGVAFSLFAEQGAGSGGAVLTALTAALTAFVLFLLWNVSRNPRESGMLAAALACIAGGAAGNLYDRILFGSVTDFLDFSVAGWHWPAFNVADSAITCGAALLLADLWRARRRAAGPMIGENGKGG
ncbi:MAG: signal peptidase II [Bryobacteraceae bacterium]|nr:signal peptidase II [Bryobacteraceae bacterium]